MNENKNTRKVIPDKKFEKPKYEVFVMEDCDNRISAIARKQYSHFTSLNNALDILINQRMKAITIKKHQCETAGYSTEVAERKFSISFSHDLKEHEHKGMFNAFGYKDKGCEITFIVEDYEKFDDVFLNKNEYVKLFDNKKNYINAVLCIENFPLVVNYAEGKNFSISIRTFFADVKYVDEIKNENNMFMGQNILNIPQLIDEKYKYQNETALTFSINKTSQIKEGKISEIEYMLVKICIEKIKQIKIKFGKKVNEDEERKFKKKISEKNYTNIIYVK